MRRRCHVIIVFFVLVVVVVVAPAVTIISIVGSVSATSAKCADLLLRLALRNHHANLCTSGSKDHRAHGRNAPPQRGVLRRHQHEQAAEVEKYQRDDEARGASLVFLEDELVLCFGIDVPEVHVHRKGVVAVAGIIVAVAVPPMMMPADDEAALPSIVCVCHLFDDSHGCITVFTS